MYTLYMSWDLSEQTEKKKKKRSSKKSPPRVRPFASISLHPPPSQSSLFLILPSDCCPHPRAMTPLPSPSSSSSSHHPLLTSFLLPGCTSLPIVYHPLPLHLGASRPVSPCSGLGSTPPFLPPSPTKRMTQSIPSPLSLSLFLFPYIPFSSSHHSQLTHVDQLLFLSLFFKITHLVSSVTFKRFLCVHFCAAGGKNCVLIEALFKR